MPAKARQAYSPQVMLPGLVLLMVDCWSWESCFIFSEAWFVLRPGAPKSRFHLSKQKTDVCELATPVPTASAHARGSKLGYYERWRQPGLSVGSMAQLGHDQNGRCPEAQSGPQYVKSCRQHQQGQVFERMKQARQGRAGHATIVANPMMQ